MAWPTGRPAGSRYPAPRPPTYHRQPPPQESRPRPRPPLRWLGYRGSPISQAASANASPGWPAALAAPQIPATAETLRSWLAGLVDATATRYLSYGHGNGVMLVHSATAPNAILRTLPALDQQLWAPSVTAAWAAAAALTAIYAPAAAAGPAGLPDPPAGPQAAEETFARAVEHGDEHVIKFADTAADVYTRTGNNDALAAAVRAAQLIGR
jgi:hypothetical protein